MTGLTRRALLKALGSTTLGGAALGPTRASGADSSVVVLHQGGHALTLLDPHTLQPRQRHMLPQQFSGAVAMGPQLVIVGDDGKLLALDPRNGAVRAQRQLGGGRCRLVVSSDQRWLLAAPEPAGELHLLDAALVSVKSWPVPGNVAWLADAAGRRSFVLGLVTRAEVWELSYNERAENFYEGLVHDFRMGEGVAQRGFHNVRRMPLQVPLLDACPDAEGTELAGRGQVFNLDVRKVVARVPALQPVSSAAAALLRRQPRNWMAVPQRDSPRVDVYSTGDWVLQTSLALPRPARSARVAGPLLAVDDGQALVLFSTDDLRPLPLPALQGPLLGALQVPPLVGADGHTLYLLLGGAQPAVVAFDTGRMQQRAQHTLTQPVALLTWAAA